jgi:hypothetical protein
MTPISFDEFAKRFQALSETANAIAFTWFTVSGICLWTVFQDRTAKLS